MTFLESTVVQELRRFANQVERGECEMTEQNALDVISVIAHISISKDQACNYLNVHKSRFSELMNEGKVPKGKNEKGWKELKWYRDEIIKALHNIKWKRK